MSDRNGEDPAGPPDSPTEFGPFDWPIYGSEGDDEDAREGSTEEVASGDPDRIARAKRSPFTATGFFEAVDDGTLLAGRCGECGAALLPPRPRCYRCGAREIDLEEVDPHAEIASFTRIHNPPSALSDLAPFPVAIGEFEGGARMTARVDADYDDLAIGDPVRLEFRDPTPADEAFALSHEREWPIHVFVPDPE
jgi:uncharacterized OB-fold protein